ncbi:MAG: glycosyltransferase family 39 protein [Clostridium sp.]|nr:glycosyltransferase family 39 protein [Clostridium sp.]
MQPISEKKKIIFLSVVALAVTGLYVSLCFNQNIWTDEAFTIDLLNRKHTFGEIAAYTATDVHPPLYYFILKCFVAVFGMHFWLVKLLSVVPMMLLFVLGITYVRKYFGARTACLFLLLTAAIPCTMEYAVQMRMYAWCMLFVTGCALAAWDVFEREKTAGFIWMGVCGVCAAYSHYFAFAAVLWVYGFLFLALALRKRGKALLKWCLMVAGSVTAYLPWMRYFLGQIRGVSNSYWIPEITPAVIRDYFHWMFASDYPAVVRLCQILFLLSVAGIIGLIIIHKGKQRRDMAALFALLIPVLVVATGVTLSKLIRPIFIIRYVMPAVPLLCLSAALVYARMSREACALLGAALVCLLLMDYQTTYAAEYQSTDTDATLTLLYENMGGNDIILYNYKVYDFIYQCYFDDDRLVYIEDMDFGAGYDRIWFLCTVYNPMPNAQVLADHGWSISYVGDYGIEQNEFWIYVLDRE